MENDAGFTAEFEEKTTDIFIHLENLGVIVTLMKASDCSFDKDFIYTLGGLLSKWINECEEKLRQLDGLVPGELLAEREEPHRPAVDKIKMVG